MAGLKLNTANAPSTPATGKAEVFLDSTEKTIHVIEESGCIRTFGQNCIAAITANSGAINTAETIIVGGLSNAKIYANSLKVGTTIRATLSGTCTSTAANASTWRFRFGTAGTTADGVLGSAANSVAATSGTSIPFECVMSFTVRTIGASGTIAGYMRLLNTGTTGISAVATQVVALTPTAINTTVDNWLSVTYVAAASTTTSTFTSAFIEVVKI